MGSPLKDCLEHREAGRGLHQIFGETCAQRLAVVVIFHALPECDLGGMAGIGVGERVGPEMTRLLKTRLHAGAKRIIGAPLRDAGKFAEPDREPGRTRHVQNDVGEFEGLTRRRPASG
jgi:hypothetical protein